MSNVYPLPGGAAETSTIKMIKRVGCRIELQKVEVSDTTKAK